MAVRARDDAEVRRVYVLSPDKDLTKVMSGDRVVCVDRIRKSTLDEAGVREKFGVPPTSITDYLALVGDLRWQGQNPTALAALVGTLEGEGLVARVDKVVRARAR